MSTEFFSVLGQSCECDGNGVTVSAEMDGLCNSIDEAERTHEPTSSGAGEILPLDRILCGEDGSYSRSVTGRPLGWERYWHDRYIMMCGEG